MFMGKDLRISLEGILGDHADFFWRRAVPVGLAVVWLACMYGLLATWLAKGNEEEGARGTLGKLFFSVILLALVLASGAGLEYLVLGDGLIHSRILGTIVDFFLSLGPAA